MSTTQGFGNTGAWWGPLPHTWRCLPLKRAVANIIQRAGTPAPFMALEFIEPGLGRPVAGFDWAEEKGGEEYTAFKPGDVLFGKLRPYLAKSILADRGGCCATELLVLRPNKALMVPAYHWWLTLSRPFVAMAETTSYGTKMPRTSWQALSPRAVPSPPLSVQRTIADFLDRETARIDALVAKKERLIALLQEKRSALISHVVTRGLDPTVPLKDSGVAWLGRVPAHWLPVRLKHVTARIVDCLHTTPVYHEDGPYPAIRTADVTPGRLDLQGARRVSESVYRQQVGRLEPMAGDVVYSREGERYGIAATVPGGARICLSQRMMLFRLGRNCLPDFLMWQLNGSFVYQQAQMDVFGSTAPHVNVDTIRNYWLLLPPVEEQRRILGYLDRETARIDALVGKVREAIDKLKEYRAALITAAVTGKIDVRDDPE